MARAEPPFQPQTPRSSVLGLSGSNPPAPQSEVRALRGMRLLPSSVNGTPTVNEEGLFTTLAPPAVLVADVSLLPHLPSAGSGGLLNGGAHRNGWSFWVMLVGLLIAGVGIRRSRLDSQRAANKP